MKDLFITYEDVDSPKTKLFFEKHNTLTDAYFSDGSTEYFTSALLKVGDTALRSLPYIYGKRTFWIERRQDWKKPKLLCRKGSGDERVLLDFDETTKSFDYWVPSPDGSRLVYGTSDNGNEETVLHVLDVESCKDIDVPIPFAGFTDQGAIVWLSNSTFIYPRMNGFSGRGPRDKWLLGTKLYRHTVGDDASGDAVVFGNDSPDTVMLIPVVSSDKAKLYVASCEDELTHHVYIVDLATMKSRQIASGHKASFGLRVLNRRIYALTNYKAPRYRLLMCDEADMFLDFDEWDEVLPESDDVLKDFWVHKSGAILAEYSHNVSSKLNIYDAYGNQDAVVPLPDHTVVQAVSCADFQQKIFISVSGFTLPTTHYELRTPLDTPVVTWRRNALDGDESIDVAQYHASSSDGMSVPYFSIAMNDVSKVTVPTIIYGYGGFNIALEPSYLTQFRPWIRAGGRVVIANLRGGSEFGEEWHLGGAMQNKQQTFDDCIAVAEDLVMRGLANSDCLGVMGGSNGGLLVAAVTVQRPDLFRAGTALVPLTDMMEFYKHQVAEFWVHEYGDPRIPEQREWIKRWSPYHYPIHPAARYPALYYETALHDARVHPFHAFKMVARLSEEVKDWKGPLLLRTWTDTGHQSSIITKHEMSRRAAEIYAFFSRELSLRID